MERFSRRLRRGRSIHAFEGLWIFPQMGAKEVSLSNLWLSVYVGAEA